MLATSNSYIASNDLLRGWRTIGIPRTQQFIEQMRKKWQKEEEEKKRRKEERRKRDMLKKWLTRRFGDIPTYIDVRSGSLETGKRKMIEWIGKLDTSK